MQGTGIEQRLAAIFEVVLRIPPGGVTDGLSPQTCPKWDSLNHIHLVNGIEEEFEVQLEFDEQMRMASFALATSIVRGALERR